MSLLMGQALERREGAHAQDLTPEWREFLEHPVNAKLFEALVTTALAGHRGPRLPSAQVGESSAATEASKSLEVPDDVRQLHRNNDVGAALERLTDPAKMAAYAQLVAEEAQSFAPKAMAGIRDLARFERLPDQQSRDWDLATASALA